MKQRATFQPHLALVGEQKHRAFSADPFDETDTLSIPGATVVERMERDAWPGPRVTSRLQTAGACFEPSTCGGGVAGTRTMYGSGNPKNPDAVEVRPPPVRLRPVARF